MDLRHHWLKFKREQLALPIAYFAKFAMRLILKTCTIKVEGLPQFIETARKERCILALWHNRLGIVSEILYNYAPQFIYTAFISQSRDGEPLAILAKSYKAGRVIRVPHQARHQALKQLIDKLRAGGEIIVFTPDGPRGPCYQVKPGILAAAKETKAVIVPFTWTADRFWELKSWDRFRIPKPFSKIQVNLSVPLRVGDNMDDILPELEKAMHNDDTP
jgi:lysophospholipid acyltransferase (LPLAT)-like uncharacterized protein